MTLEEAKGERRKFESKSGEKEQRRSRVEAEVDQDSQRAGTESGHTGGEHRKIRYRCTGLFGKAKELWQRKRNGDWCCGKRDNYLPKELRRKTEHS